MKTASLNNAIMERRASVFKCESLRSDLPGSVPVDGPGAIRIATVRQNYKVDPHQTSTPVTEPTKESNFSSSHYFFLLFSFQKKKKKKKEKTAAFELSQGARKAAELIAE